MTMAIVSKLLKYFGVNKLLCFWKITKFLPRYKLIIVVTKGVYWFFLYWKIKMSAHTYKKRVLQSMSGTFRSPKVDSKWCKIEKVRKWSEWSQCSKDLRIIRGLNVHKFQEAAWYKRIFISFLAVIFQFLLLYIFTC